MANQILFTPNDNNLGTVKNRVMVGGDNFTGDLASFNGKVFVFDIENIPDPLNPLHLPPNTIRAKFSQRYEPTRIGDSQTLVDANENIWDIYIESNDWTRLFSQCNELLEILGDKVKMDLPQSLVDQELTMAKQEHDAAHSHCDDKDCKNHKWDEKQEKKDAERRVKLGLVLAEWGTQHKVDVNYNDMQQAIWEEASRYPDPKQIFAFYNKNQNALAMLRGMIFERKALDAMLTKVTHKEKSVPAEELFKQATVK